MTSLLSTTLFDPRPLNSHLTLFVDYSDEKLVISYLETHITGYFDALYHRYTAKVYARCVSMLPSEDTAQDAVQDIFIKVFLQLHSFKQTARFSTWLYAITYNHCNDFLRAQRKEVLVYEANLLDFPDESSLESAALSNDFQSAWILQIFERLSLKERTILQMKYQDNASIKVIALHFNKKESAIKMQIKRARARAMKHYLEIKIESHNASEQI